MLCYEFRVFISYTKTTFYRPDFQKFCFKKCLRLSKDLAEHLFQNMRSTLWNVQQSFSSTPPSIWNTRPCFFFLWGRAGIIIIIVIIIIIIIIIAVILIQEIGFTQLLSHWKIFTGPNSTDCRNGECRPRIGLFPPLKSVRLLGFSLQEELYSVILRLDILMT